MNTVLLSIVVALSVLVSQCTGIDVGDYDAEVTVTQPAAPDPDPDPTPDPTPDPDPVPPADVLDIYTQTGAGGEFWDTYGLAVGNDTQVQSIPGGRGLHALAALAQSDTRPFYDAQLGGLRFTGRNGYDTYMDPSPQFGGMLDEPFFVAFRATVYKGFVRVVTVDSGSAHDSHYDVRVGFAGPYNPGGVSTIVQGPQAYPVASGHSETGASDVIVWINRETQGGPAVLSVNGVQHTVPSGTAVGYSLVRWVETYAAQGHDFLFRRSMRVNAGLTPEQIAVAEAWVSENPPPMTPGVFAHISQWDNGGLAVSSDGLTVSGTGNWRSARASLGFASGSWAMEFTPATGTHWIVGVSDRRANNQTYVGADAYGYGIYSIGNVMHGGQSINTVPAFGVGDAVRLEYDADTKTLDVFKNGSPAGSVNCGALQDMAYFTVSVYNTSAATVNFGQSAFTTSGQSVHAGVFSE